MLRMYLAQQCLGLGDEATEEAVYDSHAIRCFVGVDLGRDRVPDAPLCCTSGICSNNTSSLKPVSQCAHQRR